MIRSFFRNWFYKDERIGFFALVFSAMTISVEDMSSIDITALDAFSKRLELDKISRQILRARTNKILDAYYKNDIDLNDIVKRIKSLLKYNKKWVTELPIEALRSCIVKHSILQRRFFEFIMSCIKTANNEAYKS